MGTRNMVKNPIPAFLSPRYLLKPSKLSLSFAILIMHARRKNNWRERRKREIVKDEQDGAEASARLCKDLNTKHQIRFNE